MVAGVEEVSPEGGSRGGRRVVIKGSFLRCRRVRGSSRGGSTPPPLLLPLVLSLLPGLGAVGWTGRVAFSCRPLAAPAAAGGVAHAVIGDRDGQLPDAGRPA